MKLTTMLVLVVSVCLPPAVSAQETPASWRALIEKDSALMARIGFAKLTARERDELAALLATAYAVGGGRLVSLGAGDTSATSAARSSARTVKAYETRIESDNGDVLRLDNGAIVQISSGYVGYLGFHKRAILYGSGS